MSPRDALDPEFVRSVIAHMNNDHADACLSMVKAYSKETSATRAHLHDLDRRSMYFTAELPASGAARQLRERREVKIDFRAPLRNELEIRGTLVSMASQARSILAS